MIIRCAAVLTEACRALPQELRDIPLKGHMGANIVLISTPNNAESRRRPLLLQLQRHCADRVRADSFSWSQPCVVKTQVAPGDVMVLASDGLFDNLFDEEIANIVDALLRVRVD